MPRWFITFALIAALATGCGTPETTEGPDAADAPDAADTAKPDLGEQEVHAAPDVPSFTGKCAGGPTMCDDGNPCTTDRCDPHTGCSNLLLDCKDGDACTVDLCDIATGKCRHDEETCDDGNLCTVNVCEAGQGCVVQSVLDCSDGDACTADGCSPTKGCLNTPLVCEDDKSCTADSCDPQTGCVHKGPGEGEKCCEKDADCEDDSACTENVCKEGTCRSEAIYGCCKTDLDCDDDNACTADTCTAANGACSHAYGGAPGCCANDVDCEDNDPCTTDHCVQGKCGHDVSCCTSASDCAKAGSLGPCAEVTCTAAGCASWPGPIGTTASCCQPQVAKTGFEAGTKLAFKFVPGAWGAWKIATGPAAARTGQSGLLFRGAHKPIPGGGKYARAISPWIDLPAAVRSDLRLHFMARQGPKSPREYFRVRIRTSTGDFRAYQYYGTYLKWKPIHIDLTGYAASPATRKIRVVIEVQPSNKAQPEAFFRVDDVAITSTCHGRSCTVDGQCNDNQGATTDRCVTGRCVYGPQTEYCESSITCNDGDFCTSDYCSGNVCKHMPIKKCCHGTSECIDEKLCTIDICVHKRCKNIAKPPSQCCSEQAQCDDGNPCTLDVCPAAGLPCQHTQTDPSCCVSDSECDDGDKCSIDRCKANQCDHRNECCATDQDCDDGDPKCTDDKCTGGKCAYFPTGAAGCCEKDAFSADFEGGTMQGFTLKSSLATSKWQAWSGGKAYKGKGALYYGNPAKGNYDDGISSGSATSGDLTIAAGEKTTLSFALYMDTEGSATYDGLEVYVLEHDGTGTKKYKVWDKKAKGFKLKEWGEHIVDLSAFGSRTVQLQWYFNTKDGLSNSGEGVYLDEIHLRRSCADYACNNAKDCDDGHAFSVDSCQADKCAFKL